METKKKISRRDFMRMAGMAAGAGVIAACTPQVVTQIVEQTAVVTQVQVVKETAVVKQTQIVQQLVTPTPLPVKIDFLCDPTDKIWVSAAATYTAANPNVTIKLDPGTIPGDTGIVAWLAAGTAPDVFRYAIDASPSYGLINLIYDFAPTETNLGMVDQWYDTVWKGYLWKDGQQWCLPTDANTFALWSNPVVFKNAGISAPPTVWSDFEAACKAITVPNADKTKAVYGFGIPTTISWTTFFMYWWIFREGGTWYDGSKMTFMDPLAAALTKLRGLITAGYLPQDDNWQADYWYSGRMGMQEYGQWVIPGDVPGPWNDNKPTGAWTGTYDRPTFTVSPLPKLEDTIPDYSILAGFGYYSPMTNKLFEDTVKFLNFTLMDPTVGQWFVNPNKQLPVIKSIKHPWLDTDIYKTFMTQLQTSKPFSTYPEVRELVNVDWVDPVLSALNGKMTVKDAIADMVTIGGPIIQQFQSLR